MISNMSNVVDLRSHFNILQVALTFVSENFLLSLKFGSPLDFRITKSDLKKEYIKYLMDNEVSVS